MKRAALLPLLAGLVLLFLGLRQASQTHDDVQRVGEGAVTDSPRVEHGEAASLQAPSTRPVPSSHPVSRRNPPDENLGEPRRPAVGGRELAPETLGQLGEDLPVEESLTEERQPLKRYENADALALRRARQIELVTRAQEQADEALEEAEASGDTERAARTRGVLRRLRLRLDALEAAASALEPY